MLVDAVAPSAAGAAGAVVGEGGASQNVKTCALCSSFTVKPGLDTLFSIMLSVGDAWEEAMLLKLDRNQYTSVLNIELKPIELYMHVYIYYITILIQPIAYDTYHRSLIILIYLILIYTSIP